MVVLALSPEVKAMAVAAASTPSRQPGGKCLWGDAEFEEDADVPEQQSGASQSSSVSCELCGASAKEIPGGGHLQQTADDDSSVCRERGVNTKCVSIWYALGSCPTSLLSNRVLTVTPFMLVFTKVSLARPPVRFQQSATLPFLSCSGYDIPDLLLLNLKKGWCASKSVEDSPKDVPWGRKTRGGAPLETACMTCTTILHAYPDMTWPGLVAKASSCEAFKAEIAGCRRILRGKPKTFFPQTVNQEKHLKFKMYKDLLWLPQHAFVKMYGKDVNAKDLGLAEETLVNEHGDLEVGFVLSTSSPFKHLQLSWEGGTIMTTRVLDGEKQLRSGQGADTQMWAHKNFQSNLCPRAALSKSATTTPPTAEEVETKVKEIMAQPKPEAVQLAQTAPLAQQGEGQAEAAKRNTEDEVDSDDEQLNPAQLLQSSAPSVGDSSKRRKSSTLANGSKREKADKRKATQTNQAIAHVQSRVSAQAKASAPALAAVVGGASAKRVKIEKTSDRESQRSRSPGRASAVSAAGTSDKQLLQQHERYLKILNLSDILGGASMGNEANIAKRIKDAFEARSPGCSEVVEMKARLALVSHAKRCRADLLGSLARADRSKCLAELCPHVSTFPSALIADVADGVVPVGEGASKWVDIIRPQAAPPGFAGLASNQSATLVQQKSGCWVCGPVFGAEEAG